MERMVFSIERLAISALLLALWATQAPGQRLVPKPAGWVPQAEYDRIHFSTSGIGYVATRFVLLRTTDRGLTWSLVLDTYEGNRSDLMDVFFLDQNTFWVYGNGGFFRTGNQGETLEHVTLQVPYVNNATSTDSIRPGFFFFDAEHGWAFAREQFLFTSDGGKTWHGRRLWKRVFGHRQPNLLWMFGPQTGIAAGDGPVYRTEDEGKTWTSIPGSPDLAYLKCSGAAWCLGLKALTAPTAYVGTDGGRTWTTIQTGIDRAKDTIYDFQVNGPNDAVMVGSHADAPLPMFFDWNPRTPIPVLPRPAPRRGLLLRWDGTTWTRTEHPEIETFRAIHYVSPTEAWATADVNGIIHSTDGGQTWTLVPDYYQQAAARQPTPTPIVPPEVYRILTPTP